MPYNNVTLCEDLKIWNHDPEKLHIASGQIDNVFSGCGGGIFQAELSMSSARQCLVAKISLRNGGEINYFAAETKFIEREISGALSDIYCGGNDEGILTHHFKSEIIFEIHENPIYQDEE